MQMPDTNLDTNPNTNPIQIPNRKHLANLVLDLSRPDTPFALELPDGAHISLPRDSTKLVTALANFLHIELKIGDALQRLIAEPTTTQLARDIRRGTQTPLSRHQRDDGPGEAFDLL